MHGKLSKVPWNASNAAVSNIIHGDSYNHAINDINMVITAPNNKQLWFFILDDIFLWIVHGVLNDAHIHDNAFITVSLTDVQFTCKIPLILES